MSLVDTDRQRSSSQWMAEVDKRVTIAVAESPEDCLAKTQELAVSHDFVIGDGPGGLDEIARTLLLLADLAVFPITPSILDLRSVAQATTILRYAQGINRGRPIGRLVLNKIRTRDTISRELRLAAPNLGVAVTNSAIRDLQAFRDAAQQGTIVSRMGRKGAEATKDTSSLCEELLETLPKENEFTQDKEVSNG